MSVLQPCILFPANAKDASEPVIVCDLDRFLWGSEFPDPASDENVVYFDRSVRSIESMRFRLVDDIQVGFHCTTNHCVAWMTKLITLAQTQHVASSASGRQCVRRCRQRAQGVCRDRL